MIAAAAATHGKCEIAFHCIMTVKITGGSNTTQKQALNSDMSRVRNALYMVTSQIPGVHDHIAVIRRVYSNEKL